MLYALYAVVRNVLMAPLIWGRAISRAFSSSPQWVEIRIRGNPPNRPSPWWAAAAGAFGGGAAAGLSVEELTEVAQAIAADRKVEGVVWRIGPLSGAGWAKAEALRRAVAQVRDAGKRSVAWLVEPGHPEWLVAGGAAEVRLHEASAAVVTGVSAEVSFFGGAAARFGVQAQMERIGEYKGAVEPWTRAEPSEQFTEAMNAMVGALQDDLVSSVAAGRGWDLDKARAVLDAGPYTAQGAEDAGLVDGLCGARDLTKTLTASGVAAPKPKGPGWFIEGPTFLPLSRKPEIAVVGVQGLIRTSGGGAGPGPAGSTADDVIAALEAAARDSSVAAVVLHVDSRGGSAIGSDLIWDAVRATCADKPVVAWMGEAAASGGYYVACGADHIIAAPGTLTGSIGVIAGKLVYKDLLDKIGVGRALFAAGPRGGMFSPSRPFDEAELDWLRDEIQAVYDKFVSRVVEGRGMAPDAVDRYGRGRVWTGRQALERGLVDSLGGWPEALALARDRAGLPLEKATSVSPTRPRSGGLLDPRRRLNSHIASIVDPQWLEAAWLGGPQGPRVAVWAPLPRV